MTMSIPHSGHSMIRPYYHRSTTVYTTVIRSSICPLAAPVDLSGTDADSVVCHG